MQTIEVKLPSKSYDIYIGYNILGELNNLVKKFKLSNKGIIVSDYNVSALYGNKLLAILKNIGLDVELIKVPAGETSKSLNVAQDIYTRCIELGLDRKSPIFALGGGVVGDLAGFIAATYMRGIPFIQIPTTLLAQVDSSIGGKVAINHSLGKNLIGTFYQPLAVLADMALIHSLPAREMATGLGEIIKYGIIYDEKFFNYLENNHDRIVNRDLDSISHIVTRSCEIKAIVVGEDEKETDFRRILNFGHTIAHAIEKETNYKRYNHGEAVAIGILGAAYISERLGYIDDNTYNRIYALIECMNLPIKVEGVNVDNMYEDIFHDKKTINGHVHWVLMESIGKVFVSSSVPEIIVREAMTSCIYGR